MKVNELRIGNWINVGGELNEFDIADFCDIFDNGNKWFKDLFKAIPLTEEWLVKFGFSHISKNDYQSPYEFLIFDIKLLCFADIQGDDEERIFSPIEVKYVHQLQNLYFALTGEELEIK